jgi:Flp pilus assembly pilin Flp
VRLPLVLVVGLVHRGKGEEGQTLAEYVLIVALIALVAVVVVVFFGSSVSSLFSKEASKL